jgi:type IV pilus assembly protein PilA
MRDRKGFTLVELLVVVIIVGILAAIAIPKSSTTKNKAKLASIKTDLRNFRVAQEAYYADKKAFGTAAALQAAPYRFKLSPGNAFTASAGAAKTFSATVQNASITGTSTKSCRISVGAGTSTDGVILCP